MAVELWWSSPCAAALTVLLWVAAAAGPAAEPDGGSPRHAPAFTTPLASLTVHNTSASPTYDQAHFAANFGATTCVARDGATIAVDPARADRSLNPVTPGHVSAMDVHGLVPSRPDLRWFAHVTPWFGGADHIAIGIDVTSPDYVAAMVADVQRRGFDGVMIDWYGQGRREDAFVQALQRHLATRGGRPFAFALVVDGGIPGLSEAVLEDQLRYAARYFADPAYERDGGAPLVLFFGVDAALGTPAMAQAKAAVGAHQVWAAQGAGALVAPWADQAFDWSNDFADGVATHDPANLAAVSAFHTALGASPKHGIGAMCAGFDGTLTANVGWSLGKYLPRAGGATLLARAARIDAVIPANVTRMQWVTWNDWEEGTAIEGGIENDATVVARIDGSVVRWTCVDAPGDASTIDHVEIYATVDGVAAARVASLAASAREFDLATCGLAPGGYAITVLAVGKPSVRDHRSDLVRVVLGERGR